MFRWAYAGVNTTIYGAGGPNCVSYLSPTRIVCETLVFVGTFSFLAYWALDKLTLPKIGILARRRSHQLLLVVHCLVFGIELGFKLATESLIWSLNPCHVLTLIQIIILASNSGESVTFLYRLQMHMLNGPLLALTLPVLNTRLLPWECTVYFVQHALILLVPMILLDQSTVYSVEPIDDISWVVLSLSLQVLYHFLVLQPIALLTGINLNNILCPAISDPFKGPNFRVAAMLHQPFLILILGKCVTCFSLCWSGQSWPWLVHFAPDRKHVAPSSINTTSPWLDVQSGPSYWTDWFRYPPPPLCTLGQPPEARIAEGDETLRTGIRRIVDGGSTVVPSS